MLMEINDANRNAIVAALRGPLVCMQIISDIPDIEEILGTKEHEILATLITSLKSPDCLARLSPHISSELFYERLEQVQLLEPEAQTNFDDLIEAIKYCDVNFMEQLNELILLQDTNTQVLCNSAIERLTQMKQQYNPQTPTYCDNTYENHPRGCLCEACDNLFPYLERGYQNVQNLLWSFASTLQNVWDHASTCCKPRDIQTELDSDIDSPKSSKAENNTLTLS